MDLGRGLWAPVSGGPAGAGSGFPGSWVGLRAAAFAALLAVGVAVAMATSGPGDDIRVPAPAVAPAAAPSGPPAGERAAGALGSPAAASGAYGKLPLAFEPNRGQSDGRVRFLARGAGYGLFLTAGEAVLSLTPTQAGSDASGLLGGGSSGALGGMSAFGAKRGAVLRFGLVGANPDARIAGSQRLPGQSNYMLGNDPRRWQTAVPNYAKVRYHSVYPGTDLVYYGRQGQLEYDFVLAPGADPDRIAFSVAGAQRVSIDGRGDLVLSTAGGEVMQRRPVVYQQIGSQRRRVAGRYVLQGQGRVGFEIGSYDRSRPLVIDPVIAYSSYLGGSGYDRGYGVAVDASGMYLTGNASAGFPTQNAAQANSVGGDVFVSKLNAAGNALVYSTYLGGTYSSETGLAVAVDGSGNAYVTGETPSPDFPVAPKPPAVGAPIQPAFGGYPGGTTDAFVAKLTATGALAYSTYLGGLGSDSGQGIAVDSAGSAYVTGTTSPFSSTPRSNFPTKNALQPVPNAGAEAFVSKLTFTGMPADDLVYSTFLGGASTDDAFDIALDAGRAAYVTGRTYSTDFPTANALQPAKRGDSLSPDAFVSKLNAAGSALSYSTYLGGSADDLGRGIAVDGAGSAYVTGQALSTDFPTANPLQPASKSNGDAFVSKYNAAGSAFVASTYLGGSGSDTGYDIAVDSAGSAHVAGETRSTDFPTRIPVQAAKGAGSTPDAFVSKLSGSTLSDLAFSTYLGGNATDLARDIAVDSAGSTYVTGYTSSTNFPTASAFQPAYPGGDDAFVTKLMPSADLSITKTDAPDPVLAGQPLTYTLAVQNAGPDVARAVSVSDPLPAGVSLLSASQGCTQSAGTVTCSVGDLAKDASAQREITVRADSANPALANTATVQSQTSDPVAANNSATATTEVRVPAAGSADVSLTKSDSPDPVANGGELTYTLAASNAGPDDAQAVSVRDQLPAGVAFVSAPGCSPEGSVVTCHIGALDEDASAQREITVRPTAPTPALSNTATVASSTPDPFSFNNTASAVTTVRPVADLSLINRDFPDPVQAGEQLTYTLTAKNTGADVAPGVVISDALPDGVQFVSASGCSLTDALVSCDVGDLAGGGASVQRRIVVRPTEANPALANTASVQSAAVDSDSSNNSVTAMTVVREATTPRPPDGGTTPPPGDPGGSVGTTPLVPSGPFAPSAPLLPSRPAAPAGLVAISDKSISPRRFAAARSGPSALTAQRQSGRGKPRRAGARVSYRLNMAASVRFTVSQIVRGRRQGSGKNARCVAQSQRNRSARACRRTVTLAASFILSGKAGQNSFTFTGRLANRKLRPGSYMLTATPTANGKTGKPASLSFTIAR